MVTRLYLRHLVGFEEVNIDLNDGLVVLSGPSGAGKSVLLGALLSLFGFESRMYASVCEATLRTPKGFEADDFAIDDETVVKQIKKENVRFFLNDQRISKKRLRELFKPFAVYLSVRDRGGLESGRLLDAIDNMAAEDKGFARLKKEYRKRYAHYAARYKRYEALVQEERSVAERREFLRFEIDKIAAVDPKPGEEIELLETKKRLSKLDKIKALSEQAAAIFAYESAVERFYEAIEGDGTLFSEAMNQLRSDLDASEAMMQELEELDVEAMLDRLGALNGLIKRFGSLEEALAYKRAKEEELNATERLEHNKRDLERFLEMEGAELATLATRLSTMRQTAAKRFESALKPHLEALKLPKLRFTFRRQELAQEGIDRVDIALEDVTVATLSGGEFNRIRLAIAAVSAGFTSGKDGKVFILDEIDANVSGDESIAIAELIAMLAKSNQVFAVSHQPHLAAKATQHLLVRKKEGKSSVGVLDEQGRIDEIARIVGGEKPTDEAYRFAKRLRDQSA